MPRRTLAAVLLAVLAIAACIDVPDSMRAEFAPPGKTERSNYRPGNHGAARPLAEPGDASVPEAAPPERDASVSTGEGGTV